jgi:hypothetical protein
MPSDRFTGKKTLIDLVGRECRGFLLIDLTGTFALILGMAAVLLEISGT